MSKWTSLLTLPLPFALVSACGGASEELGGAQHGLSGGDPRKHAQTAWFREEHEAAGVSFHHRSDGGPEARRFPEIMGGGVALLDMELDGDLDLYFVQSGELDLPSSGSPANALYRNEGSFRFTDVTDGSAAADRGYGMGVATGDVDGDGLSDLFVTNVGPNVLFHNHGDGTFEDVTEAAGVGDSVWSTSAAMLDMDADGDLDLFVCNYVFWSAEHELGCFTAAGRPDYCSPNSYAAPLADSLFRNEGQGTFTDVSAMSGLSSSRGNGLGVVAGDFDGDHDVDIFVANDQMANHLWRNEGDGTFTDIALLAGCAVDQQGTPKAGMGTLAEDVDDDGDLDLLVVNLRAQADSFFRNEGNYFIDDTAAVGLGSASRPFTRFGVGWVDFDNDGWLDLYEANGRVVLVSERVARSEDPYAEPNTLFSGHPDLRYRVVSPEGGVDPALVHTSRAVAFGDLDNDGGVDAVVVNRDAYAYVLRNTVLDGGHWIRFRVIDDHGGDAIGAVLALDVGDRALRREVKTAYGYCAANDPRVHIGLGEIERVGRVRVRWPGGGEQEFGPFDVVDREFTLRPTAGAAK